MPPTRPACRAAALKPAPGDYHPVLAFSSMSGCGMQAGEWRHTWGDPIKTGKLYAKELSSPTHPYSSDARPRNGDTQLTAEGRHRNNLL